MGRQVLARLRGFGIGHNVWNSVRADAGTGEWHCIT